MLPLKYLINFCRTHEIPLINCKIADDQELKFTITDTKLYASVVILSAQYNTKIL